ncbi:MAG: DNA methylase [Oscillospiraceae bacterium]|jgi:16S rRNA G966 N2-methylase RsmD|nr:DNA methylase [Oscillospiraceae bacterium]
MIHYAVLANPGHSRVYFSAASTLSVAELEIARERMESPCDDIKTEDIAGIPYITFTCEKPLGGGDIDILSQMSFVYALFERRKAVDGEQLIPVAKTNGAYLGQGIGGMLKYAGKTNELFTRMMINVAFHSAQKQDRSKLRLLDPVAGKGTTLLEALSLGFDAAGIEINEKPVHEFTVFFKKYLETGRYKHTAHKERLSGHAPDYRATVHSIDFAATKEAFKTETDRQNLVFISGDSRFANKYFRKNSFDIIVGDLPYGIAHGNATGGKQSASTRHPGELLRQCLPGWHDVLRPGGALALSWNQFLLPYDQMAHILAEAGLHVLKGGAYAAFEHRVDQAINRNIVVALKKASAVN